MHFALGERSRPEETRGWGKKTKALNLGPIHKMSGKLLWWKILDNARSSESEKGYNEFYWERRRNLKMRKSPDAAYKVGQNQERKDDKQHTERKKIEIPGFWEGGRLKTERASERASPTTDRWSTKGGLVRITVVKVDHAYPVKADEVWGQSERSTGFERKLPLIDTRRRARARTKKGGKFVR